MKGENGLKRSTRFQILNQDYKYETNVHYEKNMNMLRSIYKLNLLTRNGLQNTATVFKIHTKT